MVATISPAQAWGPEAPLPPTGVTAVWTEDSTLVSWLPAAAPLTELTGYTIYRMDEPGPMQDWTSVGATAPDVLQFVDTEILPGVVAFYYVVATSLDGPSPPSQPTVSGGVWPCVPPFKFEVDDAEPPTTWVEVYWWCIWTDPGLSLHLEGGG